MKRVSIPFFLILLSLVLLLGTTFSEPAEKKSDSITPVIAYEESIHEKTKRQKDHVAIAIYLKSKHSDIYGGTYTSIEGEKYFLLTEPTPELEKKIKGLSAYPDSFVIKQAEYSEKQLEDAKRKLSEAADVLDLQGVGLDIENNKVLAYTTIPLDEIKDLEILKEIDPGIIHWEISDGKAKYELL